MEIDNLVKCWVSYHNGAPLWLNSWGLGHQDTPGSPPMAVGLPFPSLKILRIFLTWSAYAPCAPCVSTLYTTVMHILRPTSRNVVQIWVFDPHLFQEAPRDIDIRGFLLGL